MSAVHINKLREMLDADCYDFLIYFGGSGGDILCHTINKYSILYQDGGVLIPRKNNRFMYQKGFCYSEFKKIGMSNNIESLNDSNLMFNNLVEDSTYVQTCKDIDLWYNLFLQGRRFIIKMHNDLSSPKYLSKRKYIIWPDSDYWLDYTFKLRGLKVDLEEIILPPDIDDRKSFLNQFISEWHPYVSEEQKIRLINDIIEMKVVRYLNVYSTLSMHPFYDKNLFLLSDIELIQILYKNGIYNYNERLLPWRDHLTGKYSTDTDLEEQGYNIIPMSKLLDYKFMKNKFHLHNYKFTEELTNWHYKNLELLNSYNYVIIS